MADKKISDLTTISAFDTAMFIQIVDPSLAVSAQNQKFTIAQLDARYPAVTLAGSLDYITISGQVITRNAIDLSTDVTGALATGTIPAAQVTAGTFGTGAYVFDNSVSGITTLTATALGGTLSTAAQPNVTSLGTLTSLQVDSVNINGNTIQASTGNLVLEATEDATRDIVLNASDGVLPAGTSKLLGKSTNVWNEVWTNDLPGTPDFQSGLTLVGDSDILNKYEINVLFTPEVADAQSAGNTAAGTFQGSYSKIGRFCFVNIKLNNIDTTGMTGANNLWIRNLPFVSSDGNSNDQFLTCDLDTVNLTANTGGVAFQIEDAAQEGRISMTVDNAVDVRVNVNDLSSGVSDIEITGIYITSS